MIQTLEQLKNIDQTLQSVNFNDLTKWHVDPNNGACFKHVWKTGSNFIFTAVLKNEKVGIYARKYLYLSLLNTIVQPIEVLGDKWEFHQMGGQDYAHLTGIHKVHIENFLEVLLKI